MSREEPRPKKKSRGDEKKEDAEVTKGMRCKEEISARARQERLFAGDELFDCESTEDCHSFNSARPSSSHSFRAALQSRFECRLLLSVARREPLEAIASRLASEDDLRRRQVVSGPTRKSNEPRI